jgi:hypothetical protein
VRGFFCGRISAPANHAALDHAPAGATWQQIRIFAVP